VIGALPSTSSSIATVASGTFARTVSFPTRARSFAMS
jgi:hypothetical protein